MIAATLLILINMLRVVPLVESPVLNEAAQARAEYLCENEFSHAGMINFFDMEFEKSPYIGKNLARGYDTDLEAHLAFIQSPSHLANMLWEEYKYFGSGEACGFKVEFFSSAKPLALSRSGAEQSDHGNY